MKRKDWKIKKLIKDTYGKKKKTKIRQEKLLLLRKLFLRKNRVLSKKNLVPNYLIYNSLLLDFFKRKNFYLSNFYLFDNAPINYYNPNFFYKKKLFNSDLNFYNLLKENELRYIFVNNNVKNFFGNSIIIFGENKNILKNIILKNEKEDIYLPIELKFFENKTKNNFNFLFNYNLNICVNLEIYKILILLYINRIENKNK